MLNYEWKNLQEALWGGVLAAGVAAAQILTDLDRADNWETWLSVSVAAVGRAFLVGLGMGFVRVFGGKSNR